MRFFVTLFIIALLVFLGVLLFNRSPNTPKLNVTSKTLVDYADTDAQLRLTVDGMINGDDVHRQIRITVNNSQRTIDIIGGYNGNVINTKSYPNNTNAFRVFLEALVHDNFAKTRKTTISNEDGFCQDGQRYFYELLNTGDSKVDFKLWGSSCGGGTEGGQGGLIRSLFRNQISDYDTLTNDVQL